MYVEPYTVHEIAYELLVKGLNEALRFPDKMLDIYKEEFNKHKDYLDLANSKGVQLTLLHPAIIKNAVPVVNFLLDSGIPADLCSFTRPHDYAAWSAANPEMIKVFLDHGFKADTVDDYGRNALFFCQDIDTAKVWLKAGADVNAYNHQDNQTLCYINQLQTCEFYDNATYGSIDSKDPKDTIQLLELYLKAGADPNVCYDSDSAINRAAHSGNIDAIKLLHQYGATSNPGKGTPNLYFNAVSSTIKLIASEYPEIDINAVDTDGDTAIQRRLNRSGNSYNLSCPQFAFDLLTLSGFDPLQKDSKGTDTITHLIKAVTDIPFHQCMEYLHANGKTRPATEKEIIIFLNKLANRNGYRGEEIKFAIERLRAMHDFLGMDYNAKINGTPLISYALRAELYVAEQKFETHAVVLSEHLWCPEALLYLGADGYATDSKGKNFWDDAYELTVQGLMERDCWNNLQRAIPAAAASIKMAEAVEEFKEKIKDPFKWEF